MLRIAVPNKGSLSEPAAEMLREAGYRQRRDTKELVARRPRQRRRVLLPAPARHRRLRRLRHARRRHHRPRPAARLRRRARVEVMRARLRGVDLPVRRPAGHRRRASPTSPGTPGRDELPGPGRAAPRPSTASAPRSCGSTAPSRPRSRLGVADVIADVVETGTTLRSAGLEVFGEPILRSEAVLIRRAASARTTRPSRCCAAGCRASSWPAATCCMDYDVRGRARRRGLRDHARAWSRRPSRRCTTAAGSPSARWCRAAGRTRSWTSSTTSAPGPSSSPTSTPAGSDACIARGAVPARSGRAGSRSASPSRRPSCCSALAVLTPGNGPIPWHWYDRLGMVLLAVVIAYVLLLFARLRATPGPDGLVVRNVVT